MKIHTPDVPQLAAHQGYIEIPESPSAYQFEAWWDAYYKAVDKAKPFQFMNSGHMRLWRAAFALLKWGKIEIENLPQGDITEQGDKMPLAVFIWVGKAVDDHMAQFTDLKNYVTPQSNT